MAAPPLTHHDVLALVEPFARRGRHVDLAASNRLERRLVFKSVDHPGAAPDAPGLRETLQLEVYATGTCQLTRTLARGANGRATLQVTGPDVGALLAAIDAVPPLHHFRTGAGFVLARSYVLQPGAATTQDGGSQALPVLARAVLQLDALTLTLNVPAVRGVSGDLTLVAMPGEPLELPEDLLAVLGWDWARLIRDRSGWNTRLRLRGSPARRTRKAEAALDEVAAHLARTLSEPPAMFHDRLAGARWGVTFRRGIPVLTIVALLIAVATLPRFAVDGNPALLMLLFHVPTAFIVFSLCMQELARFEIPPWPRRSRAVAWRQALADRSNCETAVPLERTEVRSSP
jgi:hypothetical protein